MHSFVIWNHVWWQLATIRYCQQLHAYPNVWITTEFAPVSTIVKNGQHMKIHWSFTGISYLAQEVTVIFAKSNHMSLKSKKLLLKVCWQGLAKWSLLRRQNPCSVSNTHAYLCWSWNDAVWCCDLACSCVLYCIVSYVFGIPVLLF